LSASDDETSLGELPHPRALCPRCGTVFEPFQEYCLACGERLAETGAGGFVGWIGRFPLGSRRVWIWPVIAAFTVAVLASVVAILAIRGKETSTLKALGPKVRQTTVLSTAGTARTTTRARSGTTQAHTETSPAPKPPKPPVTSSGVIAWPGPPGYTIVLASIPVSSGKSGARRKALEAIDAGLEDVGVLKSSDYSSLHPGYFVVFSGVYGSEGAAAKHLTAARKAGFDSPYAKRVAS
jgi:hypothetical protein